MDKVKVYFYALVLTLLFAGAANAQLYGLVVERNIDGSPGSLNDGSSTRALATEETFLYMIDPDTGLATKIGGTGYFQCTGMDFHPVTRVLYAVCINQSAIEKGASTKAIAQPDDFQLVTIDLRTGAVTEIGPTGVVPADLGIITDLSFRSDGALFAQVSTKGDILLGTINIQTGAFTQLGGPAGVDVQSGGLAFSRSDVLYSADTSFDTFQVLLHMRDQATGGANFIAGLNLQLNEDQFPFVTSMDLNPADGVIYAYLFDQGAIRRSSNTSTQKLLEMPYIVTIDPDTGIVDWRAGTLENVTAIAFLDHASNIPTLSEWGMVILASCMLMGSLLVLRRRTGKGII